ncbi:MAG: histone deacetylase [Gemmatimonadetes bacterium]|nr:histone deacetylase [Gemmatimonadota bacterium]MBK6778540.1 histone deacetylase [Gemmatimonadota bacterium]MBK7714715.1 histone deacetylase [Gemmatimonadota bacterium]MBK7924718.1 histone deacetylase [Gemmatimonadota bacterium]MBK9690578.1 histone deacetylase [Gemmatimonadota bacterium]
MNPVAVFTHPDCIRHDPGPGHPEAPARLIAVVERLEDDPRARIAVPPAGGRFDLLAVHPETHLRHLEQWSAGGGGVVSVDTITNEASWPAVLGAVGAVIAAVDHAHAGRGHAFAAVRPPGHHALAQRAMGFCLVNNVLVGARRAQRFGRERVLVIDWDVHHGNGTQALMEHDETVRYVSLHQHPWYPGTGMAEERGVGNVFNVPRGPGAPAERYVEDLWAAIVAATDRWTPEMVFLSAGYDAMAGDPLGGFTLEARDFVTLTTRLRERLPRSPVVAVLEGGYVPARVAEGVAATVGALL